MSEGKKSIITDKDVLILQKLLEDGRKSSSSISKEIDLGREIVNYRIKRLIKENLIVKFVPKLNEEAMHYREYIILLKLNLEDELSKDQFIREKLGNKYIVWTVKSESGWDLVVRLYAESVDEFKEKLGEILENFSSVLASYYTIISSEEIKESEKETIARNLFDEEFVKKDFEVIKKEKTIAQLDDKDKEIIKLLETDARIQYKEIAEKLDISSDTVKYRIDKMRSQGVIENFAPVINFSKLGFIQMAGILKFQFLPESEEQEFKKFIAQQTCVTRAIKSLNSEEFFLNLLFEGEEELQTFKKEIQSQFGERINILEMFNID